MDETNSIIKNPGKITNEIYLIDLLQYGFPRTCSAFIFETSESIIIMDTGTSNDIHAILKFMQNQELSLKKTQFLIPSHYHFDHFGGAWKLWAIIKEKNPNVKILTTEATQNQLQNPIIHMKRAKRTFGDLIGEMKAFPDNAFEIVSPNEPIRISGLDNSKEFMLISSPGHTPDQVCPTLFEEGKTKFMYLAEAAGSLFHSRELITIGTGMPPDYNFKTYIKNLNKIIELKPHNTGYCHF
ncbi:MAG: MBL fold metallo-hydrolase, partial [Promethearchaeota archaeon]